MKKSSLKSKLIIFIAILTLFIILFFVYYQSRPTSELTYSSYFHYSKNDINRLRNLSSKHKMTINSLRRWDEVLLEQIRKNRLGDKDAARILAYVYVAQRDALVLSYKAKHTFTGSFGPVTAAVLCSFFAKNCESFRYDNQNSGPYSDALSKIILRKVKARIVSDTKRTKLYPVKEGPKYWKGEHPFFGQEVGSWKPWLIRQGSQFRVPSPPNPESSTWNKQLQMTKNSLAKITERGKQIVIFWAGNPGTVTPPGQWIILCNDYMWIHKVSFSNMVMIRSVLAMGIADAVIAAFDSKYSYFYSTA